MAVGVRLMTAKKIIEMKLAYLGISNAELARRLGWSPQLLNKRMSTGKFSVEEWEQIAAAVGATVAIKFRFADGTEI